MSWYTVTCIQVKLSRECFDTYKLLEYCSSSGKAIPSVGEILERTDY